MITKIDHIGIAVKNLDESLKKYKEIFGLSVSGAQEVPEQKVKVVSIKIGESNIELLEATSDDSAVAKFIEKRGEGVHHIAFSVTGIEKMLETIEEKGITLIDKKPRIGAHNKKIAFLHPKSTDGVLIELCENNS